MALPPNLPTIYGQYEHWDANLIGGIGNCTDRFLYTQITGGVCLKNSVVTVTDAAVVNLAILGDLPLPRMAMYAFIEVIPDPTQTDSNAVIAYTEALGAVPSAINGLVQSSYGVFTVGGGINLTNFNVIGIEAGKTHELRIAYYG